MHKTFRILLTLKLGNIYLNNISFCSPTINNVGNFFAIFTLICSPKHKQLEHTTTQQTNRAQKPQEPSLKQPCINPFNDSTH